MIRKIQSDPQNFKIDMYYYQRARDAMFDAILQLSQKGYKDVFIPGYIGWSPREGSGIFDPINRIEDLQRHYYKMTCELSIDIKSLANCLREKSILLIVNYFGFRDKSINEAIDIARKRNCVIIEDNAHGFFTFFCEGTIGSDITFFSLHKMFPFEEGGSLLILNKEIDIRPEKQYEAPNKYNPFAYDIIGIARKRRKNYKSLMTLMGGNEEWFTPLKSNEDIINNVPQTFPIIVHRGNRDKIYEVMNERGFGVVSLYHTMITELQTEEHSEACWLSKHIMNLPVHQDCNAEDYLQMIENLKEACKSTYEG